MIFNILFLGLLNASKGAELDAVVGPTPMTTGPQGDVELLRSEALLLNADAAVRDAVLADIEPVSIPSFTSNMSLFIIKRLFGVSHQWNVTK